MFGISTTRTTGPTITTLKDPYPVSITCENSPKTPIIFHVERANGALSDLDPLWRKHCAAAGKPWNGSFEWYLKEDGRNIELKDRNCPLAQNEEIPAESRKGWSHPLG